MKLAILADIHDHRQGLSKVLERMRPHQPEALVLCGDLTRDQVLWDCHATGWPIHFCLGNCDASHERELRAAAQAGSMAAWGQLGKLAVGPGTVAFTHYPSVARAAAESGLYQAVFYGHTHRPGAATLEGPQGSCLLANPGDIQGRYGRIGGLLWDSASGQHAWIEA